MRRRLSCRAYSFNVKNSSFLNPYICLFSTFILLFIPSVGHLILGSHTMQVLCNHQRFIQVQHIVKPCLVFGIKDVVAVSQQYPARALEMLEVTFV